jgi:hypothetical protein
MTVQAERNAQATITKEATKCFLISEVVLPSFDVVMILDNYSVTQRHGVWIGVSQAWISHAPAINSGKILSWVLIQMLHC